MQLIAVIVIFTNTNSQTLFFRFVACAGRVF
jgi:hypothetical protein